ncbi:MAG: MoxR family ATPase [Gammaproteobacteria bacterium]|nr:MoxR family ATPase [Gammaproteobacteria bacterium]MDH5801907.1 MoxR family ATPase [Gammaproteobacteria bacterium]
MKLSAEVPVTSRQAALQRPLQMMIEAVIEAVNARLLGKERQVRLALACVLARGHLLLEDRPGVGKTTLAQSLAQALGLSYNRIQFTADLMPGDILGGVILGRRQGEAHHFEFRKGPIFSSVVLADEINRASPRCQSALLEAMEEQQVSVDGHSYDLPDPFFVIATQNPQEQLGTFALPESQLDRFHMRLQLGFPDEAAERLLLSGQAGRAPRSRRAQTAAIPVALTQENLLQLQQEVEQVFVADPLLDYLQQLLRFSRESSQYQMGLSPRAGLALRQCAQAWAYIHGRTHVQPEDIQTVLPTVVGHRLQAADDEVTDAESLMLPLRCMPIS